MYFVLINTHIKLLAAIRQLQQCNCFFYRKTVKNRSPRQGPEIFTPEFFRFTGRTQAIRTGSRNFGFQQAVLPAPIADKTAFYRIFAYDSQRKPYSLI